LLHESSGRASRFETACPWLFDHEMVIKRLLEETYWGKLRLRDTIKASWPKVDVDRVLGILRKGRARDEWVDENRSGPNQNAGGAEAVGKMVEDQ